ncbi:hypothetical protein AB9N12_03120 [Bacteroides sp. AN502(2024)]|uniref:hypothetical protein n=1 Tax=Bacteroides sp. AN502(2024) TaxID=3160599 RepID=UPI003516FEB3
MGIRWHCTEVTKGDNHFFGGAMKENQRMDILNSLRLVYPQYPKQRYESNGKA